ncbi:hypothetical protein J1614_001931 [Plenodomus biglobosus]|nr:hypothetical protein J1614_001931 [Plenodomus biglobosus]
MPQSTTQASSPTHSPTNITTINYTLSWPHLDNPTDTTFTSSPFDLCNCPRPDVPPGHIYTRYTCSAPTIHFVPPAPQRLWVLQTPQTPFNILRPATQPELTQRAQLHNTPNLNLLLLTGPSPRGRYQAHATLLFLQSLPSTTIVAITSITLLAQPFEEDSSHAACRPIFTDLAVHIRNHLPAFRTLYLCACDARLTLRGEVCAFSILLQREGVSIVVEYGGGEGRATEYRTEEAFLAEMGGAQEGSECDQVI